MHDKIYYYIVWPRIYSTKNIPQPRKVQQEIVIAIKPPKKVEVDHAKAEEKAKRGEAQRNFESHSQPEEEYCSSDYEENISNNSNQCFDEAVELQITI